jgi:hypothetical protein
MIQSLLRICRSLSSNSTAVVSLFLVGLLLLLAGVPESWAQKGKPVDTEQLRKKTETEVQDPTQPSVSFLDVTNSTLMIRRDGLFPFEDPFTGKNGSFPRGAGASVVFGQGLMWGGQVSDGTGRKTVRVNGSTYFNGMAPGGLRPDGTPEDATDEARFHVWRVDRGWATEEVVRRSAAYRAGTTPEVVNQSMVEATREQYRYDWNNWPASDGAPYEECNGQPGYQPADAEAVASGTPCAELEGDIPGKAGTDQTLWLVTNDIGSESEEDASRNSYGSPAIGMETQFTIWGYDRPAGEPLSTVNFIEAELIYRGVPNASPDARIDSLFVSWWADPDVGSAGNDFAGVDTSRALGFAYNATASDPDYASINRAPPAVGWDVLKGLETQDGDTMGLSSFIRVVTFSLAEPDRETYSGTLQWYNWMRGLEERPAYPQNEPYTNPLTGEATKFMVPGDPVTGQGWVDGSTAPPGERKLVNTTGPVTLQKGDTARVVVGQIAAQGSGSLKSVEVLRYLDGVAQFEYDRDARRPEGPRRPAVRATSLDTTAVLNWGYNQERVRQTESYSEEPGYKFEAYRVYQLPGPDAKLSEGELVATFDIDNTVKTLEERVFDPETGSVYTRPVQSLPDEGIQRHARFRDDRLRDRPLANGVDYHYAVTAVGYTEQEGVPIRIRESPPARVTVRPREPAPGAERVPEVGQEIPVERVGDGVGTVEFETEVVDPALVEDATYTITFGVEEASGRFDEPDGFWNLQRDGDPVLSRQPFGFNPDRRTVDGIKVNVGLPGSASPLVGVPPRKPRSSEQLEGEGIVASGPRIFGFPSTSHWYADFYSGLDEPKIENAQQDLEFRFTSNGTLDSDGFVDQPPTEGGQLAKYYGKSALRPPALSGDPEGAESTVIRIPFELWEVEGDTERQINVAIVNGFFDNHPWGSGAPSNAYYSMHGLDYIIPIHTEYNERFVAGRADLSSEESSWWLFFDYGGDSVYEQGDVFRWNFANPLLPEEDVFALSTEGAETGSREDARAKVEDIGVFPNPYRGYNRLQDSVHDRFVRFRNLPAPSEFGPTTIRLFTLSGAPVEVIEHTEGAADPNYADWNLRDADGELVATGIYLAYVNTPVGSKTLKVAVAVVGTRGR